MPWLLYRYILGELLRVFALSCGVLVMVIAFGAAIKPLAANDLIGAWQTAKYIMLAAIPMLQFALPFAAGFAATIVLHRLTSDHEIQAAAVSGISYRRILGPIVAMGVVLVAVMVLLTQSIVPRFWTLMEQNIAADVTRAFRASIDKGVPFQIGNIQIYADRIVEQPNPQTGAETRLILLGMAAAELDLEGRVATDVTARQAVVDIHRRGPRTYIQIEMRETVAYNGKTGELIETPVIRPRPLLVPNPARDHPMLMTRREMLRLREHPDEYSGVMEAKVALAEALRESEVWRQIDEILASQGTLELFDDQRVLTVKADRLARGKLSTSDGRPVTVRSVEADGASVLYASTQVVIGQDGGSSLSPSTFALTLEAYDLIDEKTGDVINQRARVELVGLEARGLAQPDLSTLPYEELMRRADGQRYPVPGRVKHLDKTITELRLQIESRLQRRYALSLTAMLLLVLGSTLAMVLRDSLPLVIYVWAFVPSILDVILISGGGHMVRSGQVAGGTIVLWSGNALLAAIIVFGYRRLIRN
ncbi:MAG: LptF/LptG family permease [Phycisphaerales bacterium]